MKPNLRHSSIVARISLALASIVLLGMTTMLVSYWISEKAENDSLAINMAGSLRMQSYRIGLLSNTGGLDPAAVEDAKKKIDATWKHPVFDQMRAEKARINETYQIAYRNWQTQLLPSLAQSTPVADLQNQLEIQTRLLDSLVTAIQLDAEHKIRSFRLVQIIALFSTLFVSALVMYSLKVKVEQRLFTLTSAAKKISQGDFSYRIPAMDQDELGVLAQTFNKMNDAIGHMYDSLEQQVDEKTRALTKTNTALQFLYDTAKFIIEHNPQGINYDEIISRLSGVTGVANIELCLMTESGNSPYLQIMPEHGVNMENCTAKNCQKCLSSRGEIETTEEGFTYRFQLNRELQHFGVLVCKLENNKKLSAWQEQLIQSVADQLAIGLSLKADEDQSRRIAVLQERTVIARELHDSLAQALSYLKIQVTRLNSAINKEDKSTMEDVADELKQGLNNAYRQLRELLTTFRLKVDGDGLKSALEFTAKQLADQSTLEVELVFNLTNVPLTPNEEIHLLQIVREASQNAIHHSEGTRVEIRLWQDAERKITLAIEDNGKGMAESPEKINHYGLAIMRERGKHLNGKLIIENRKEGGTGVYFKFLPDFILKRENYRIIAQEGGVA